MKKKTKKILNYIAISAGLIAIGILTYGIFFMK